MNSNSIEINDEFLLQCISNYKPLFDKNYAGYKSVHQKENCWKSVAASVGTDVNSVKARFKALREKYRREIQAEEKYTRSGAPACARRTWPLMSFFKFLSGSNVSRETTSNVNSEELDPHVEDENSLIFVDTDAEFEEVLTIPETSSTPITQQKTNSRKRKNRIEDEEVDSALKQISTALGSIKEKTKEKSKFDKFGEYLVAELKDLGDEIADEFVDSIT